MKKNTPFVVHESLPHYEYARQMGVMHNHLHARRGKWLILDNHQEAIDFINCSYLGLDMHPHVVNAYYASPKQLGVNFCCARTRLTNVRLQELENRLSNLFKGIVITFPSVTVTHLSVISLLASGVLLDVKKPPKVHVVFDRLAHASMQFLIPIVEQEARVSVIPHNDIEKLMEHVKISKLKGEKVIYFADGIYSMGGVCPIKELLKLSIQEDFYLYIDDAHGTSLYGEYGEGYVLSLLPDAKIPSNLFITFSLTKGFGVAGGGIIVGDSKQEDLIRTYGLAYAFSAPLDFSATEAAHAALDLHLDGTVLKKQKILHKKVALFDQLLNVSLPFHPIRMVKIGDEKRAIDCAKKLLDLGFLTLVAFFPIVARKMAQLRICLSSEHTNQEIIFLAQAILAFKNEN